MTDLTKSTLKSPIVLVLIAGAVSMTTTVILAYSGLINKIDSIDKKVDIYIAQNAFKLEGIEDMKQQVAINTLTIKTITEFIKPDEIKFKSYRK